LLLVAAFPLGHAQETEDTPRRRADAAFEQHRYHQAIPEYEAHLQDNPDDLTARLRLATSYFYTANQQPRYYQEAAAQYRTVVEEQPFFPPPYVFLGQIAYIWGTQAEYRGETGKAEGLFRSAQSWFAEALELYRRQDPSPEATAQVARIQVFSALAHRRLDQPEEAAALVAEAVTSYASIEPETTLDRPLFSYFLDSSLQYVETGLYDQALVYLEGAWYLDPRPEVSSLFAVITSEIGRPDQLPAPLRESRPQTQEPSVDLRELARTVAALSEAVSELQSRVNVLERRLQIQMESGHPTAPLSPATPASP
jgi:tetratricopeptide (TPR) repeat protein